MFCPHCGNKLSDGDVFCGSCGNPVTASPENSAPANQQQVPPANQQQMPPVNQEAPAFTPAAQPAGSFEAPGASPFASPFAAPSPAPKPNPLKCLPKKALIGAVAALLSVAIVLTAALNFERIKGSAVLLFGSDEDYFEHVEGKELKGYVETAAAYYDSIPMRLLSMDTSSKTTIKLNADEKLLSSFLSDLGYDGDLSFLEELELESDFNLTEDAMEASYRLVISGKKILSVNMTVDFAGGAAYLAIPEISSKTMKMELPEDAVQAMSGSDLQKTAKQLREALPSEKELVKLLEKYIDLALDSVDKASVDKTTLTVSGVSENCRKVVTKVSEKTLAGMAKAVFEEMKKDKDLKEILVNLEKSDLVQEAAADADLYDGLMEIIDEALEEIDEADLSTDELFRLTDYVNSAPEIIGRELEVEGETVFYYATAKDGKNTATKLNIADQVYLKGSGTQKGDKISGKYSLTVSGQDICDIKLTDFNTKKLMEGYPEGSICITPSRSLLSLGGGLSSSMILSMFDPSLELVFDCSKNKTNLDVNLLSKGDLLLGVSIKNKLSDGSKVKIPSKDLLDMEDEDAISDFADSLNFNEVRKTLKKTKLKGEILDAFDEALDTMESYLTNVESFPFGGSSEQDFPTYDDDDDFDDFDWDDIDWDDIA